MCFELHCSIVRKRLLIILTTETKSETQKKSIRLVLIFFGNIRLIDFKIVIDFPGFYDNVVHIVVCNTFQELPWDESMKSLVLSSFFWGYPLTQVFIGQMAQKYGAKYFLAGSLGLSAVLTLLTPVSATYGGVITMCINRMVQGMAQVSEIHGNQMTTMRVY